MRTNERSRNEEEEEEEEQEREAGQRRRRVAGLDVFYRNIVAVSIERVTCKVTQQQQLAGAGRADDASAKSTERNTSDSLLSSSELRPDRSGDAAAGT